MDWSQLSDNGYTPASWKWGLHSWWGLAVICIGRQGAVVCVTSLPPTVFVMNAWLDKGLEPRHGSWFKSRDRSLWIIYWAYEARHKPRHFLICFINFYHLIQTFQVHWRKKSQVAADDDADGDDNDEVKHWLGW